MTGGMAACQRAPGGQWRDALWWDVGRGGHWRDMQCSKLEHLSAFLHALWEVGRLTCT